MTFQWLPITSLQSLFAEFVAALLQCLFTLQSYDHQTAEAVRERLFATSN